MKTVYALRCFINGRRVRSCKLTKGQARCFRVAAKHMTHFLTHTYKLGAPKVVVKKRKHLAFGSRLK